MCISRCCWRSSSSTSCAICWSSCSFIAFRSEVKEASIVIRVAPRYAIPQFAAFAFAALAAFAAAAAAAAVAVAANIHSRSQGAAVLLGLLMLTHTHNTLAVRLSPQLPFFFVLLVYPGAWVIAPFLGAIFVVSYFAIGRVVSRVRCRAHVRILCLTTPPLCRLASCPHTVLALERSIGCQCHHLLVDRKHAALGTGFDLRARGSRAHRAVQQDTAVVRGLPLHRSERVLQGRARRRSELGLVRAQIIPWTLGGPPSGIREYGRLPMLRTGRRGREPSQQTARAHLLGRPQREVAVALAQRTGRAPIHAVTCQPDDHPVPSSPAAAEMVRREA